MALWKDVVRAFIASHDWDQATLSRLAYWEGEFADREITSITEEDIDAALVKLAPARVLDKQWKKMTALITLA